MYSYADAALVYMYFLPVVVDPVCDPVCLQLLCGQDLHTDPTRALHVTSSVVTKKSLSIQWVMYWFLQLDTGSIFY